MIKRQKCVYNDVIYGSKNSCASQLIIKIDTDTVFYVTDCQSRLRNLGTLCHERHIEIGTRAGTLVIWQPVLSMVWKKKTWNKQTNKQKRIKYLRGNVNNLNTTYLHYESTHTNPFAANKIKSRISLKMLGMRIRMKTKFDNTTKPVKRNEQKTEKLILAIWISHHLHGLIRHYLTLYEALF